MAKHIPQRTCMGCNIKKDKKDLIRIVKDKDGKPLEAVTNDNGIYILNNICEGKYIAIFDYDTSVYNLTKYKQEGVSEEENSDVLISKLNINNEQKEVPATDIIEVSKENIDGINIGLTELKNFDLKLDKYVSKMIVQNDRGTTQTEYDNETTAKVEIDAKNLSSSNVIIEYKIVVTNEGAIPGYVNKIVDYLPDDVTFSSEVNTDWYVSNNGDTIYSSALANQKINPGESKEVTLVLTKKLTKDSLGSIMSNTAEIYEATNEAGMPDIDSEPANKLESEDDFGQADIVLSVVTGKIIGYSIIIIVALGIVVAGIIIIKKKVLNKK